jgi:hypothetical protein
MVEEGYGNGEFQADTIDLALFANDPEGKDLHDKAYARLKRYGLLDLVEIGDDEK